MPQKPEPRTAWELEHRWHVAVFAWPHHPTAASFRAHAGEPSRVEPLCYGRAETALALEAHSKGKEAAPSLGSVLDSNILRDPGLAPHSAEGLACLEPSDAWRSRARATERPEPASASFLCHCFLVGGSGGWLSICWFFLLGLACSLCLDVLGRKWIPFPGAGPSQRATHCAAYQREIPMLYCLLCSCLLESMIHLFARHQEIEPLVCNTHFAFAQPHVRLA